jgi:Obg family GTPase CgtA-like protein
MIWVLLWNATNDHFRLDMTDPAYPGQRRVSGDHVEQIARMTHWEYPEAAARFGRQLEALGIAVELERRGALDGDLVMIDTYDFSFSPRRSNPYIPQDLLDRDAIFQADEAGMQDDDEEVKEAASWRPFPKGGYMDVDTDELVGFTESDDWDMLDDEDFDEADFDYSEDDVWMSQ